MSEPTPKEVTIETRIELIDRLIPTESNPRKISRPAYEKLKKSLLEFPEMKQLREIVVDEDLQILGGHQRIYALRDLGYTDVTIKQVFGLTDKQKREFIIKDNTAAGTWDTDLLANHFDIEQLTDWGVPDFGSLGGDDDNKKEKASGGSHTVTCPDCGSTFDPNDN